MQTVSLRTLVREPLKVKRITRTGRPVQVNDNGHPLWVIHPAENSADSEPRREAIEAELLKVLGEPKSDMPLSRIVVESRR